MAGSAPPSAVYSDRKEVETPVIHVGINVAEVAPHQVCIMDDRRVVDEFRVPNNGAGLASLLRKLAKIEPDKSKVLIAVERPDGPFVGGLLDAGYTVYPVNPKSLERYRERFSLGGIKTDLVDVAWALRPCSIPTRLYDSWR